MKAILALLLGLVAVSNADSSSSAVLDWDSQDSADGDTTSYNGMMVRVYQSSGTSPTITLGTDVDDHESIYCLNFKGFFESLDYDTSTNSDATYSVVSGSMVTLNESGCTVTELSSTSFEIDCGISSDGNLSLVFDFTSDEAGDYGVEYTVNVVDYDWVSTNIAAKFVMVQSLTECSTVYPYQSPTTTSSSSDTDSDVDSEDTESDDTDSDDDDDRRRVRRLLTSTTESDDDDDDDDDTESDDDDDTDSDDDDESTGDSDDDSEGGDDSDDDSDSADEEAGVSSDDSNEFDNGYSRFVLNGQAYDQCDVMVNGYFDTPIDSTLVYQTTGELHVVFEHFSCDLYQDPRFLIDEGKVVAAQKTALSAAAPLTAVLSLVIGSVMMLFV